MKKNKTNKSFFFFISLSKKKSRNFCVCVLFTPPVLVPPARNTRLDDPELHRFLAANDDIALFGGLIEIFVFFFIEYRPPIGTKMTRSMKREEK